jgi:3-methyl-2-oxobutanoate hydroxymethyltransferase
MTPFHLKHTKNQRKLSMITCYDATSARVLSETDIDILLVGDSVSMVVHGYDSTVHATLEMMVAHTAAVARGCRNKVIVADMPFLAHRKGLSFAMDNADRLMKAGAHAIKLEGVRGHEEIIKNLVEAGIPVMGHLGLTPQSVHQLGGYKVQGKTPENAEVIQQGAQLLEKLGCFSIVLECIPKLLAQTITKSLSIPTIGIGAGPHTDGQVLVYQDLLGLNDVLKPKFVRTFLSGKDLVKIAVNTYHQTVLSGDFPTDKESYS